MPPVPVVACEALAGLEPFVEAEVTRRFGRDVRLRPDSAPTESRFDWSAPLAGALQLRMVVAAYLARVYRVPRPKALLGDQHLRALLEQLAAAVVLHQEGAFRSFRFSAAGRGSAVFHRLAGAVAEATGLIHDPDDGDLLVRVRPADEGWEVLVRLTPRPLSTRAWRVVDVPGALNATIAAAMVEATRPRPADRVLNAMSGSATLLVERLLRAKARLAVGLELDVELAAAGERNVSAAGVPAESVIGDATRLPFPGSSFDAVLANLPYGHRMGSHESNPALYRAFLDEAARVSAPGARLAVITHELRRFQSVLRASTAWRVESEFQVFQKGHHPRVWVLTRG